MAFTLVTLPSLAEEMSDDSEEDVPLMFGPSTFFASPFDEDDNEEYPEEVTLDDVTEVNAATVQQVLDKEKARQEDKAKVSAKLALERKYPIRRSGLAFHRKDMSDMLPNQPVPAVRKAIKRNHKNITARNRASQQKERVEEIEKKPEKERTEQEQKAVAAYYHRKAVKNRRSKLRTLEKKSLIQKIEAKPEAERTQEEKDYVALQMERKAIKNLRDRQRRARHKQLAGLKVKPNVDPKEPLINRIVKISNRVPKWESNA